MLTVKQKQLADVIVDAHYYVEHFGTGQNKASKVQAINLVRNKLVVVLENEPGFDGDEFISYIAKTLERKNQKKAKEDAERKV
jgi:hypothetical protein